ncbi:Z-ring formation inhibitor MciZ [Paenibacillus mendelii]|uniref:Z-ring formation inhibitor MciZ n=1 Tax=Paenibacillus mendelii TaxID=206163 RepID=A0ABV6JH58_9BACL|nr:Z-ring formation inhibitor MciZ [Paenibacillus mendelii]MCQ6558112.1 Z-ring formation inhibitor MciZ [Paenibacillus mendelii]
MKQYSVSTQLMLVGKAWEIRHQLRLMTRQVPSSSQDSSRTLGEYLEHRRPLQR